MRKVTRTIKSAVVTCLVASKESGTVAEKEVFITTYTVGMDAKKLSKEVSKKLPEDEVIVKITDVNQEENIYWTTEEEFLQIARRKDKK